MRFNGCLKEKINVIRRLENFLNDFEKKVSTLFEPKVLMNPEKFSTKFLFKFFLKIFLMKNFYFKCLQKIFEALYEYVLSMKNVLQDQSYLMHAKSNLYDTFKEIYSQKKEAVVKFHGFVAPLTIFGAI